MAESADRSWKSNREGDLRVADQRCLKAGKTSIDAIGQIPYSRRLLSGT